MLTRLQYAGVPAYYFFSRVPGEGRKCRVHPENHAFQVRDHHADSRGFERRRLEAQLLFHAFAPGGVSREPGIAWHFHFGS